MFHKIFYPCFIFIIAWLGVFGVREVAFLNFHSASTNTSLYITFFLVIFLLGYISGLIVSRNFKENGLLQYSLRSVNAKADWLIIFSAIGILLALFKFFSLLGGFSFGLSDITELRFARGRDSDFVKGQSFHGVLAMIFSGFPIIAYIFKEFFYKEVTNRRKKAINIVFLLSIFVSLLSGGRWAAATSIVVVYFMSKIKKISASKDGNLVGKSGSVASVRYLFSWFFKFVILILIVYIFGLMFMHRVAAYGDGAVLIDVLNNNFSGVNVPLEHEQFLLKNTFLIPIYYVISLFQYYIAHGIYQLDVLVTADYPNNAPYLFTYQYYLFVMVFNKLGLGLMTVDQILAEIPNPGVYFTLAGAYYLDFGFWGSGVAGFVTSMLGAIFWTRFLKKRQFLDAYISILFLVLIVFSPIVAITSTGVFPSMFALLFILIFFVPRRARKIER